MSTAEFTPLPASEDESIRDYVGALPHTDGDSPIISESDTQRTILNLESSSSALPNHLRIQAVEITDEIRESLEPIPGQPGFYAISEDELQGTVSRATMRGAAQAAADVGKALRFNNELELLISGGLDSPGHPTAAV